MERLIRTIRTQSTNGETVFVNEYQEFLDVSSFGRSAPQRIPGMTRLELRGGGVVNLIDKQTFQIVATGERLTVL
jgi:hypothetical protein